MKEETKENLLETLCTFEELLSKFYQIDQKLHSDFKAAVKYLKSELSESHYNIKKEVNAELYSKI